jgi:cytochrome P450
MKDFPLGSKVRLEELSRNPYPIFRQLQAEEPVSWIEETQMWFVTLREDVLAVLVEPEPKGNGRWIS